MARALFKVVDEAFGSARENAGAMAEGIRDRARERAQRAVDDAEELSRQGLESFQGAVRGYPLSSCALFAGMGALLGGLLAFLFRRSGIKVAAARTRRPRVKSPKARAAQRVKTS